MGSGRGDGVLPPVRLAGDGDGCLTSPGETPSTAHDLVLSFVLSYFTAITPVLPPSGGAAEGAVAHRTPTKPSA